MHSILYAHLHEIIVKILIKHSKDEKNQIQ
jgi:hypothetical protein